MKLTGYCFLVDTAPRLRHHLHFGRHFSKTDCNLAKHRSSSRPRRRIPHARRLARSPGHRTDVTRAEYNRIIDILNERNVILNGLREAVSTLQQASDTQFKRIAQIQAELDGIKRASERRDSQT
jgi:hypothetical protein